MKLSKKKISALISFIVVIIGICNFYYEDIVNEFSNLTTDVDSKNVVNVDGELQVYFMDVGQADSILIRNNDFNMLIDAGNNEDGSKLVTYFKSLGIEKFDYVVGTHAHEDHIGGMDDIINNFDIGTFYMPDAITTTMTFEDVLDALESKSSTFNTPDIGDTFNVGDARVEVLYTGTDTRDLNNTSIVLRVDYGNESFLFMGDATSQTEKKILDKNIKVDLLKVGHHGSQYSTSDDFLNKVDPKYAVISVGENNTYDHPKDVTLKKLEANNIKIYRTDMDGTILIKSDGKSLNFESLHTDTNGG